MKFEWFFRRTCAVDAIVTAVRRARALTTFAVDEELAEIPFAFFDFGNFQFPQVSLAFFPPFQNAAAAESRSGPSTVAPKTRISSNWVGRSRGRVGGIRAFDDKAGVGVGQ